MIDFSPRPYQEAGLELILASSWQGLWYEGNGLLLEPGSGKTVTAITGADILMNDRMDVQKTLVVAPKRVAQEVWTREAAKWRHTRHLSFSFLDSSIFEYYKRVTTSAVWGKEGRVIVRNEVEPYSDDDYFLFMAEVTIDSTELRPADWRKTKDRILQDRAQFHVVSRDHLFVLAKILGEDWPYDLVLGDESTMFKNTDSKRYTAMRWLRERGLAKRLTLMSGTPSPKGIENLFAQAALLDGGKRLGNKITHFRREFMEPASAGRNPHSGVKQVFKWKAKNGATKRVTDLLSDICLSVRADIWRETDPPRTVERVVHLPDEAMAMYRQMEENYAIRLAEGVDVAAPQAAVLRGKLIQIASGAVFDADKNWHVLHDAKLEALDELIEELDGEPLLIVYWYKPTLARLKARYGRQLATVNTKGFLDKFGAGELPLLALQPGAAAHGLDGMQHGGHHIAVVDLFDDYELYAQVVARLDRSGQKSQVTVHQILAAGTKDRQVARVLADREADQGAVMDAFLWNARR